MGLLTNIVREWEPRWRAMLPVVELFDDVVDSARVGLRKAGRPCASTTTAQAIAGLDAVLAARGAPPGVAATRSG